MKSGLLVYSTRYPYCNLGDYVQSLAAKQFLGSVDEYVSREALDSYTGDEELRMILNGWFMHEPEHWPPAASIRPLFVSFHVNSVARAGMMREASVAYLKRWAPIGCRDQGTADVLRRAGVEAYFSGCLTLTLGRTWKRKEPSGGVIFVDPHYVVRRDPRSLAKYVRIAVARPRVVRVIAHKLYGQADPKSLVKSAAFYSIYRSLFSEGALESATYLRQVVRNTEISTDAEKFARAEELLELYSSARFVVTSRIHCALPCVGIGTPVLYVEDLQQGETSSCRLAGLRELLHTARSDGERLQCDLTSAEITPEFEFSNKNAHVSLAAALAEACEQFARSQPPPMRRRVLRPRGHSA